MRNMLDCNRQSFKTSSSEPRKRAQSQGIGRGEGLQVILSVLEQAHWWVVCVVDVESHPKKGHKLFQSNYNASKASLPLINHIKIDKILTLQCAMYVASYSDIWGNIARYIWQLYQFESTLNDKQAKQENTHGDENRGGLLRMTRGNLNPFQVKYRGSSDSWVWEW